MSSVTDTVDGGEDAAIASSARATPSLHAEDSTTARLRRELLDLLTVEEIAARGRPLPADLLEEERDAERGALIAHETGVGQHQAAMARAGLTSADHPVDALGEPRAEIDPLEERLARQETDPGAGVEQERYAVDGADLVLDRGAEPHVAGPLSCTPHERDHVVHVLGAFREELPDQVWGAVDELEEARPIPDMVRPVLEHVGHRGAEDSPALSIDFCLNIPLEWLTPMGIAEKSSLATAAPHVEAHALGPSLGVAMFAPRRDFDAPPPWIKSVVRPFDRGILAHFGSPFGTKQERNRFQ